MSIVENLPKIYPNTWPPSAGLSTNAPVQDRSLIVTPVLVAGDHAFGAEVSGVDWSLPVSEDVVQQVCCLR
jgi:hypothetical protein